MVVFLDTSAAYALADRDDLYHAEASWRFGAATEAGDEILVHNYMILESVALLSRRRGWEAARLLLGEVDSFRSRWVDEALHRAAVRRFLERGGRVSLVDEVSFLVMKEAGARHALAFDKDFRSEGFRPYPPE